MGDIHLDYIIHKALVVYVGRALSTLLRWFALVVQGVKGSGLAPAWQNINRT